MPTLVPIPAERPPREPATPAAPAEPEPCNEDWRRQDFSRRVQQWTLEKVCALTGALPYEPGGILETAHLYPRERLKNACELKWHAHNGMFLAKTPHQLYDDGYLSLSPEGIWLFSPAMPAAEFLKHGLHSDKRIRVPFKWTDMHAFFAQLHRTTIYKA